VKYLVVDGYYAKSKFVRTAREVELHIVGKLRHDANLRYLFKGVQKKFGKRRQYDGKVKVDDLSRPEHIGEIDRDIHLYAAVVNNVNLKCNIRLVYVLNLRNKKNPLYALLFSTDTGLDAQTLYRYYKARFQIEFLFRDAKQFTGLNNCQARRQESLDFHFNASLTALNLAKVDACLSFAYDADTPFSMAAQKMAYFNEHLLGKVCSILDLNLSLMKRNPDLDALRTYGAIAPSGRVRSGFGKNISNWVGREKVYPTNVLHLATECANKNHSAVFPVDLPSWFIKLLCIFRR